MPRQSKCGNLPLEILAEIITLAYRHRREKHGTADWLKQLATLSKQWGAVCQKLLFSALSFGRQGSLSHRAERPRMTFLAAQPRLAAYVTELRLYSLDTEVYSGAPGMARTMATTFPKVRILVLQKNLVREHPQIVDHALTVFTSIREIVVTTFPLISMIASSISYSFARMSLSHLSVSSSCAVAVGLMGALAATDSRHSLRCIELRWLMWDGPNVILSQRTFERFDVLCDLRVHISADCYRLRRIIDVDHDISFQQLPNIHNLLIGLPGVAQDSVTLLRRLLKSAVMPSLQTLDVVFVSSDSSPVQSKTQVFVPLLTDSAQAGERILPSLVSDSLERLRVMCGPNIRLRQGEQLFNMLGVQHRRGVLQVGDKEPYGTDSRLCKHLKF